MKLRFLFAALSVAAAFAAQALSIRPYSFFEWQGDAPADPALNHFTDSYVRMSVVCDDAPADTLHIAGFYDGRGSMRARFMPERTGRYTYSIASSIPALDGLSGEFSVEGAPASRGPVRVDSRHTFAYAADSTPYAPFGTTAYAWMHMTPELRLLTVDGLARARFNKVRMCIMPKNYALCNKEPELFPFVEGESAVEGMTLRGRAGHTFDLTRFNPLFFEKLERCVDSLATIGVEADLILFHPYDKGIWGFDTMPMEVNRRYLDYVVARLASRPNVWWSMANEYDYVGAKSEADWREMIERVAAADPSRHLLSIHGSTATYFPYHPALTHASIQDEAPVMEPGRAAILWSVYHTPVVMDEVCYEGNLPNRWGRLSGEEMLHRIWNGLMGGIYVTHGECLRRPDVETDTIMWAEGGTPRGTSWQRIGFARDILSSMGGPLRPADISRDIRTSVSRPGHYLVYFGREMPGEWTFDLPARCDNFAKLTPGTHFKVEIIDTWDMTITPVPGEFITEKASTYRLRDRDNRKILLPLRPWLLLRITPANEDPSASGSPATSTTPAALVPHEEDVN